MSIPAAPLQENAPQCVANGVTYTFTNQDLSSANACYLYDGANTPSYFNNYDATGAYTGNATTVANVGTIAGAWFQLQAAAPFVLASYAVTVSRNTTNFLLKQWSVCASTDGATWKQVGSRVTRATVGDAAGPKPSKRSGRVQARSRALTVQLSGFRMKRRASR